MGEIIRPTPVAYRDIDLSWMVGHVISEVSFHEPVRWYFTFGAQASIGVDCLWRIVERDRVVLTSEDHLQQFGLPAPVDAAVRGGQLLSKRRVTAVHLREATSDIVVEFTDGLRLEIIATSSGYENWQLCDPSGTSYFAQGGGQICRHVP